MDGKKDQYYSEHRLKNNSGDYVWVMASGKATEWDENGKPLIITGIIMDLDEKKKSEIELINKEKDWKNLFDYVAAGIVITDYWTGKIIKVNPAVIKMFGADSEDDFIGRHLREFAPKMQPDGRNTRDVIRDATKSINENNNGKFELTYTKFNNEKIIFEIESTRTTYQEKMYL